VEQWLAELRKVMTANYDRLDGVLAGMNTEEGKQRT